MVPFEEFADLVAGPGKVGRVGAVAPDGQVGQRGSFVRLDKVEDGYPACEDVQETALRLGVVQSGRGGLQPLSALTRGQILPKPAGALDTDEDRQELVGVDFYPPCDGCSRITHSQRFREPGSRVVGCATERGIENSLRLGARLVAGTACLPVRHRAVADPQVRGEVPQAHAQGVA